MILIFLHKQSSERHPSKLINSSKIHKSIYLQWILIHTDSLNMKIKLCAKINFDIIKYIFYHDCSTISQGLVQAMTILLDVDRVPKSWFRCGCTQHCERH